MSVYKQIIQENAWLKQQLFNLKAELQNRQIINEDPHPEYDASLSQEDFLKKMKKYCEQNPEDPACDELD